MAFVKKRDIYISISIYIYIHIYVYVYVYVSLENSDRVLKSDRFLILTVFLEEQNVKDEFSELVLRFTEDNLESD